NDSAFLTNIGFLLPSELATGTVSIKKGEVLYSLPEKLHRPVHTLLHDFDIDGKKEIVVSEFGDLKGQLSLWIQGDDLKYSKKILVDQSGFIRTVARDMNNDGRDDIVGLATQGDESIYVLYQGKGLEFLPKKAIRFPPIYGSSWFELLDYDGDGDQDIITVNGDNADETYVPKPYHGMRLHLNDGDDNFEEVYFYPMNGCTRVIAQDFDQDGDFDMALLSTFPDYENHPDFSFVYLENENPEKYEFKASTLKDPNAGKWFLMDSGDIDNDGDIDLMLNSLTYKYSPMPNDLKQRWNDENVDILLLKNVLK
ncbi:MAG: VCBS repeat-containing protein, partial [Pricia sp.]|nr:VCBS repeat-containing protein [Pricia sp.]